MNIFEVVNFFSKEGNRNLIVESKDGKKKVQFDKASRELHMYKNGTWLSTFVISYKDDTEYKIVKKDKIYSFIDAYYVLKSGNCTVADVINIETGATYNNYDIKNYTKEEFISHRWRIRGHYEEVKHIEKVETKNVIEEVIDEDVNKYIEYMNKTAIHGVSKGYKAISEAIGIAEHVGVKIKGYLENKGYLKVEGNRTFIVGDLKPSSVSDESIGIYVIPNVIGDYVKNKSSDIELIKEELPCRICLKVIEYIRLLDETSENGVAKPQDVLSKKMRISNGDVCKINKNLVKIGYLKIVRIGGYNRTRIIKSLKPLYNTKEAIK